MKKTIICLSILVSLGATSCKKDYICVCTSIQTGEKSTGDHFRAGPLVKKAAEESCKANNDVYNDLKDCHLE